MAKPRAIELFAGVGGFRLGAEKWWDVVWSNQWEPSTKAQHASDCYVRHFGGEGHTCEPIEEVLRKVHAGEAEIPDHDLLMAGFPCQDYSVARTLNQATGLEGKKGVLWWYIHEVIHLKRPRFILLENVDRLLKSPTTQRGRDFAVMLYSLVTSGYRVEWRVINAADYGFPQRRRRVFIVGERGSDVFSPYVLGQAFPSKGESTLDSFPLSGPLEDISGVFGAGLKTTPFRNSGILSGTVVYTKDVEPDYDGDRVTLGDILQPQEEVSRDFFIPDMQLDKWEYLKGAKKVPRKHQGSDTHYYYQEGAIAYPDRLDMPSRTILTGEGGSGPSRFKHLIRTPDGRSRRLTPIELERLNGFSGDWTEGDTDSRRAFLMGNSLVVGVVAEIARVLAEKGE